jgi:ABC-type spermidine/putrescine transport system permease subunit II
VSRRLLALYNVAGYLFLLAPLAVVIILSFSSGTSVSLPPLGFSLRWFRYLAGRDEFISSAVVSLRIATLASLGAVALGLPAALALVRERFPGKAVVESVLMSPLVLPGIVTGIALLQYFTATGVIRSFPRLVLAHLVVCTPYAIRSITASLHGIDPSLDGDAAAAHPDVCRVAVRSVDCGHLDDFRHGDDRGRDRDRSVQRPAAFNRGDRHWTKMKSFTVRSTRTSSQSCTSSW